MSIFVRNVSTVSYLQWLRRGRADVLAAERERRALIAARSGRCRPDRVEAVLAAVYFGGVAVLAVGLLWLVW